MSSLMSHLREEECVPSLKYIMSVLFVTLFPKVCLATEQIWFKNTSCIPKPIKYIKNEMW